MDENKKTPYNPKKLTPEERDKLDSWNQNKQILAYLSDVADSLQALNILLKDSETGEVKNKKQVGALLIDIKESLTALRDREPTKQPDVAKPVVDALSKLETALTASMKAIDIKPVVNVPKGDVPQVNVAAPDFKPVEKILKADLPKAFGESIKLIPKPEKFDPKPLLDAWDGIAEQLESIENAVRMKPLPGSMKINNTADNPIPVGLPTPQAGVDFDYIDVVATDSDTDTLTFKDGGSGGSTVRTMTINYTSSSVDKISDTFDNLTWS